MVIAGVVFAQVVGFDTVKREPDPKTVQNATRSTDPVVPTSQDTVEVVEASSVPIASQSIHYAIEVSSAVSDAMMGKNPEPPKPKESPSKKTKTRSKTKTKPKSKSKTKTKPRTKPTDFEVEGVE